MSVSVDSICTLTSVPQAMELTCPAGRVVVLGLKDKASEIAQVAFTKKELTVLGSRLNNHRFPEVIEMFASGRLHPELLQSALYPFEQVEDAIRLIREYPEHIAKVSLAFAEK